MNAETASIASTGRVFKRVQFRRSVVVIRTTLLAHCPDLQVLSPFIACSKN